MKAKMLVAVFSLSILSVGAALAQTPAAGTEVRVILTSADHMYHRPPALTAGDITIMDATVTRFVPVENGRDLELYIVIDDAANYNLGSKLGELHRFVAGQPDNVAIGVAFLHDGVLQIAEKPTRDHQRAASALRAPEGAGAANPYCPVSDLIDGWHNSGAGKDKATRREILLVTSGLDASATGAAVCANAETTIQDAQRAGVVVFALYNPILGYATEKWADVDAGIVHLAHVSYETGGEAYFTGHGPADSFAPYLGDIAEHLAHQYFVTFRVAPAPESGFHVIRVNGKTANLELMAPAAVWVPANAAETGGN